MIKISGSREKYLSVTLSDILECVSNGDSLSWSILHVWAVWDSNEHGSILEFETSIKQSPTGMQVSWLLLNKLAKNFDQVMEILLIGDSDPSKLKKYAREMDMYSNCSITIELVDSSYWLIKTDVQDVKDMLIKKLNGEIYLDN